MFQGKFGGQHRKHRCWGYKVSKLEEVWHEMLVFDSPTCLISSLWFPLVLPCLSEKTAKPIPFEGVKSGCNIVLCGTRSISWHSHAFANVTKICLSGRRNIFAYSTIYSLHYTLYNVHSTTLHTVHFTLHIVHSTIYTLHITPCTPHSTLWIAHVTSCTLHTTLYIPHSPLHTLHCTLHTSTSNNLFHSSDLRDCIRVRGLKFVFMPWF